MLERLAIYKIKAKRFIFCPKVMEMFSSTHHILYCDRVLFFSNCIVLKTQKQKTTIYVCKAFTNIKVGADSIMFTDVATDPVTC